MKEQHLPKRPFFFFFLSPPIPPGAKPSCRCKERHVVVTMKAWTCAKPTRALTCSATSRLIASANCSCSSSSPLVWGRACSSSEETRGDVAVGGESSKFYMLNTKKVEEVLCLHSNIHPTFIHHSPRSNGGSTAGSTRPRGGDRAASSTEPSALGQWPEKLRREKSTRQFSSFKRKMLLGNKGFLCQRDCRITTSASWLRGRPRPPAPQSLGRQSLTGGTKQILQGPLVGISCIFCYQ